MLCNRNMHEKRGVICIWYTVKKVIVSFIFLAFLLSFSLWLNVQLHKFFRVTQIVFKGPILNHLNWLFNSVIYNKCPLIKVRFPLQTKEH